MSSVQSIDRMFNILEVISDSKNGVGISELSEQTGLHKSTVHRLTMALLENGYVEQLPSAKYKLSYKLYEMGSKLFANVSIFDAARKTIADLAKKLGEVIHLAVRNNNEIIYIDKENPGSNSAIMGSNIGSSAPMYCTAMGKAMLFDANDYEIRAVWKKSEVIQRTEKTHTSYDQFAKDIRASKQRGYALDDEENELGIRCIAVPIYDSKNKICAAISLSGPTTRILTSNLDKYAVPIMEAAREISLRMGHIERLN